MKRLMAFALICSAAACGGGGGDDRVDEFVGTWNADTGGTSNLDCDDDQFDDMGMLSGAIMLAAGTDSDLVEGGTPDSGCTIAKFNVSGSKATIVSGSGVCNSTDQGVTVMSSFSKFDLTLDSAGTKLTVAASGTLTVTGAVTANCTATITGTATKGAGGGSARLDTRETALINLPKQFSF